MNPTELRFLVVDDYDSLREALERVLVGLGYAQVETAVDGQEAFEMLRARPYDFVIADLDMPRMSGLDLLVAIKCDPKLHHVPVIIMSGTVNSEHVSFATQHGVADYLLKPFDLDVLGAAIEKALANVTPPPV